MPVAVRDTLQAREERAHRQGRRLRVRGTLNNPHLGRPLYDGGIDRLHVDDRDGLRGLLLKHLP